MANLLVAGNSSNGGTAITTDTSGTLNIVTGSGSGSNAITIDASQAVTIPGTLAVTGAQTIGGNLTVTGTLNAGALTNTTGSFSGNLSFNSGYGSSAVAYGCRAWVNFNGTGTVAIRASGNVTSITDNGTGDYTVNFTNAMTDTNYSVSGTVRYGDTAGAGVMRVMSISSIGLLSAAMSTTLLRVITCFANSGLEDSQVVCVSIFR